MTGFARFDDFWLFYLREHARAGTRALHYLGTSLVMLIAALALATRHGWWLIGAPVAGYGFAWLAHVRIERNRPATFSHPLWSLAADFRMWGLWLTRRLGPELARAGSRDAGESPLGGGLSARPLTSDAGGRASAPGCWRSAR